MVGWEQVPLGDLLDVQNGFAFKSKYFDETAGMPLVRIRDLKTGTGTVVNYTGDYDLQYVIKPRDFLIGMDGEFRCYEWRGKNALLNQRVCKLNNFSEKLIPRFLFYGINKYLKEIEERTHFTTVKHLSSKTIKSIFFPLPPLEIQRRIVAVLDEAFEGLDRARAHAEANLDNAQELFLGATLSAFASLREAPMRRISDVADHCLGKMLDKQKNKGHLRNYLRNLNVRWFSIDTTDLLEMRFEEKEQERYSVRKGDLLICEGGYPGRASIWNEEYPIYFQKALHRVRFSHLGYARLLMYFLFIQEQTGELRNYFSGAGIQHFTGQSLARFRMPYPTPEQAVRTTEMLETARSLSHELQTSYEARVGELANLRQSILQRAFAGELT